MTPRFIKGNLVTVKTGPHANKVGLVKAVVHMTINGEVKFQYIVDFSSYEPQTKTNWVLESDIE